MFSDSMRLGPVAQKIVQGPLPRSPSAASLSLQSFASATSAELQDFDLQEQDPGEFPPMINCSMNCVGVMSAQGSIAGCALRSTVRCSYLLAWRHITYLLCPAMLTFLGAFAGYISKVNMHKTSGS